VNVMLNMYHVVASGLLPLDEEGERAFSVQCLLSSKCHIWNWFEESLESFPRRLM